MKSLMELSALTILKAGLYRDGHVEITDAPWCVVIRCKCNYWDSMFYLTRHTTRWFISVLPLPDIVKDYLHEVSEMMCEKHPSEDDLYNLCARCEDDEVFEDSGLCIECLNTI